MTRQGKSLLNITMLSTLSRMVYFLFVFLTSYFTSRAVSKSDFGEIQYIMLLVNLGWILFNFGIPNILSRYFTQAFSQKNYKVVKQLLKAASVSALTTVFAGIIFLFILNHQEEAHITVWIVLLLVISTIGLFYLQILIQALFAYKALFVINVIACTASLLFLLERLPELGAMAFVYTYIIVNSILSIGYAFILVNGVKKLSQYTGESAFRLPDQKSMIKSAVYFGGSAILAGLLWQRYELFVLKYSVPFADLAVYVVAFSLMALFIEPLKLIPSALIYYFANISNDHGKASEQFSRFFRHYSWLVFFVGAFVFFHAEEIVSLVYTTKYRESVVLLKILLIGMVPGTCSYVMMNMHVGLGKSRFLVVQDIIGVVAFVILFFAGNHYFGLRGAALAKSVAVLLSVGLGLWYTTYILKFDVPYFSVVGSVLLSTAIIGLTQEMFVSTAVLLVLKGIVLFCIYFMLSWLLRIIDQKMVAELYAKAKHYLREIIR